MLSAPHLYCIASALSTMSTPVDGYRRSTATPARRNAALMQQEMVIVWYEFNDEPILASIWTDLAIVPWRFRLPPADM